MLDGMLNFKTHFMIAVVFFKHSNLNIQMFDMNTAMVSLTFEIM